MGVFIESLEPEAMAGRLQNPRCIPAAEKLEYVYRGVSTRPDHTRVLGENWAFSQP